MATVPHMVNVYPRNPSPGTGQYYAQNLAVNGSAGAPLVQFKNLGPQTVWATVVYANTWANIDPGTILYPDALQDPTNSNYNDVQQFVPVFVGDVSPAFTVDPTGSGFSLAILFILTSGIWKQDPGSIIEVWNPTTSI